MATNDFQGNRLPPFPVDDATLDLLWAAMHPGPGHERTSVGDFLTLMDQLGGSDPAAVQSERDGAYLMRDQSYHEHDVMSALVIEVRRLRAEVASAHAEGVRAGWEQAVKAIGTVADAYTVTGRDAACYRRAANHLASLTPATAEAAVGE